MKQTTKKRFIQWGLGGLVVTSVLLAILFPIAYLTGNSDNNNDNNGGQGGIGICGLGFCGDIIDPDDGIVDQGERKVFKTRKDAWKSMETSIGKEDNYWAWSSGQDITSGVSKVIDDLSPNTMYFGWYSTVDYREDQEFIDYRSNAAEAVNIALEQSLNIISNIPSLGDYPTYEEFEQWLVELSNYFNTILENFTPWKEVAKFYLNDFATNSSYADDFGVMYVKYYEYGKNDKIIKARYEGSIVVEEIQIENNPETLPYVFHFNKDILKNIELYYYDLTKTIIYGFTDLMTEEAFDQIERLEISFEEYNNIFANLEYIVDRFGTSNIVKNDGGYLFFPPGWTPPESGWTPPDWFPPGWTPSWPPELPEIPDLPPWPGLPPGWIPPFPSLPPGYWTPSSPDKEVKWDSKQIWNIQYANDGFVYDSNACGNNNDCYLDPDDETDGEGRVDLDDQRAGWKVFRTRSFGLYADTNKRYGFVGDVMNNFTPNALYVGYFSDYNSMWRDKEDLAGTSGTNPYFVEIWEIDMPEATSGERMYNSLRDQIWDDFNHFYTLVRDAPELGDFPTYDEFQNWRSDINEQFSGKSLVDELRSYETAIRETLYRGLGEDELAWNGDYNNPDYLGGDQVYHDDPQESNDSAYYNHPHDYWRFTEMGVISLTYIKLPGFVWYVSTEYYSYKKMDTTFDDYADGPLIYSFSDEAIDLINDAYHLMLGYMSDCLTNLFTEATWTKIQDTYNIYATYGDWTLFVSNMNRLAQDFKVVNFTDLGMWDIPVRDWEL